jgi:hypothetical protein
MDHEKTDPKDQKIKRLPRYTNYTLPNNSVQSPAAPNQTIQLSRARRFMFVLYRFELLVRVLSRLNLKSASIVSPVSPNQVIKMSHGRRLMFVIYRFYW